jgi:flavorubredoxin
VASNHYIDESDYENVVKVTDGVYWIGFYDIRSGLHCNPYLVVDGEESVVIDGGSRPDFPSVMLKILQTGFDPTSIKALIYQHYDPDLCGSVPNFEDIIDNPDLKIISHKENNMFIRHYGVSSRLYSHDNLGKRFIFSSGRVLEFINTPYSHSAGSFVTFDHKNGVMFTSDLFGSYGARWRLFLNLKAECRQCKTYKDCHLGEVYCPIPDIQRFHK